MRLGVLGGTFDPIHIGHLQLALSIQDQLSLDRVLFIPAADPPHKESDPPTATAPDRLAMVDLAITDSSSFESSRLELDRPGKSYTADTIDELRLLYPHSEIFLIIGWDNAFQLSTWHEPERILNACTVIAGSRVADEASVEPKLLRQLERVDTPLIDVSSTDIRQRLAVGESIDGLVPEAVEAYIAEQRLYSSA